MSRAVEGRQHCRHMTGFTLVELLLAIFIFALVISAVYGAYHATFRVVNNTEATLAVAGKARLALERIQEDLFSLVPGTSGFFSGKHNEISGMDCDGLSFYSSLHIGFRRNRQRGGNVLIEYIVEEDDETGLLNLYRKDHLLLPGRKGEDGSEKYLLCDGLKGVRFFYFDKHGTQHDEWHSDSEGSAAEETGKFPLMVSIVLRFGRSVDSEDVDVFTTAVALQEKR